MKPFKRGSLKKMILTAFFIALGLLLPMAFHMFGTGPALLPMHIPTLLCGFILGAPYGALCGVITPFLSSITTGMPPMFPTMPAMMCELAAYGFLAGCFYARRMNVYPALILSMLGGRVVSGLASALFMGIAGKPYGLLAFLTGAFVTALPGILIQLVLIPAIVLTLSKAGLLLKGDRLDSVS